MISFFVVKKCQIKIFVFTIIKIYGNFIVGGNMQSFLKDLEKNYEVFEISGGSLESFKFPKDINDTIVLFMITINKYYLERCRELGKNAYQLEKYYLEKDKSGKCYLKIVGVDNKTIVIIRQDDAKYLDYQHINGKKIKESEFLNLVDKLQRKKVETSGIAKRFLKDEIPQINGIEEMKSKSIVEYYKYLEEEYIESISENQTFVEPENIGALKNIKNIGTETKPRKNSIIDYEERRKNLLKYNPFGIYKFIGVRSGEILEAYVYENDGYIIAIIEPINGTSYTKIFNLGNISKKDKKLIIENIKEGLEASAEISLNDPAIIRKSHTSLETYQKNLETLFGISEEMFRLDHDFENSKNVYTKK